LTPSPPRNRQFRLARRPAGLPRREDWAFVEEPAPAPAAGQLLVRVTHISLDPAMRDWMDEGRSYAPVALGEVMRAAAVGRVVASRNDAFRPGDHVTGVFGVQDYAVSDGREIAKVDASVLPLPVYLSALGATGLTAYFGLLDVGRPRPGETVVVSAAAGATGMIAGQIARILGCRVVGICGGGEKRRFVVEELGFDAAIDYKADDLDAGLRASCPAGLDVYFDNVGGRILEAVMKQLACGARVVVCGAISRYNETEPFRCVTDYWPLLTRSARMQGFRVFDYAHRYGDACREIYGWLASGRLKSREQIVEGLESFPEALLRLFRGDNIGKLILKIAD
jgi:NADPH-dependent curcumin reductase CurA